MVFEIVANEEKAEEFMFMKVDKHVLLFGFFPLIDYRLGKCLIYLYIIIVILIIGMSFFDFCNHEEKR